MGQRFVTNFMINRSEEFVWSVTQDFFAKEGFQLTEYKGERVWKKGNGWFTGPQFMKVEYGNGQVHLEAWLKFAILPGVYCGEYGIDGARFFAVKAHLRTRVDALIRLLMQPIGMSRPQMVQPLVNNNTSAVPPMAWQGQPVPPIQPYQSIPQMPARDPKGQAVASLVLGLVGIIAWVIPLFGYPVCIIGMIMGGMGIKSSKRGLAVAGLVLCILFLVATLINSILGVLIMSGSYYL